MTLEMVFNLAELDILVYEIERIVLSSLQDVVKTKGGHICQGLSPMSGTY